MFHCFAPDEKVRILGKAREYADIKADVNPWHCVYKAAEEAIPEQDPH